LFCPGNRADMLAKLGGVGADAVAIDLEDGVPAPAKETARPTAREAASALARDHPEVHVFVRVNPVGSPWVEADIEEALPATVAGICIPKVERAEQLDWAADRLDRAGLTEAVIIGGLETAAGVEAAPGLAHPRLAALYFGAEDYIADVGGERTESGHEVAYARARAVMATTIIGVAAIDQVVIEVRNGDRFTAEAVEARQLGYSGKMCLHPAQVPLAHEVFSPTAEEVDRARRLLEAAADARRQGRGVILFEGQMVDVPVIRHAERVLERAGADHQEGRR
jgi:citrate lyase subunit beta/citryl-CoA lyase